jgi:hypothetical protein
MQLHGFNLHGLSCYYNDREVVKKNVNAMRWNVINSYDESIRNTYERFKKRAGLDAPPEEKHDKKEKRDIILITEITGPRRQ